MAIILFILLTLAIGGIGGLFTADSVSTWYPVLVKPMLNPPNWVFGPVWTILYILMGVAMGLVYGCGWRRPEVKQALIFFALHLLVNLSWSIIFFGFQKIGIALGVIVGLWVMIVISIYLFGRVSKKAAWLLAPYLLWVSFAGYLNYSLWMLN